MNTNKHDKARLLHLFCDASFFATWCAAHQVKDRAALDDKETPNDHWGYLADQFNDYERNPYKNLAVQFGDDDGDEGSIPGLELVYKICKDINPSQGLDSRPLRDGEWIKTTLRDFKSIWCIAYDNYKRSGQQDAADPFDEFTGYFKGDEVLMYAFALFKGENQFLTNLLGKLLPNECSGDTTFINDSKKQIQKTDTRTTQNKRKNDSNINNNSVKNINHNICSSNNIQEKKLTIDFVGVKKIDNSSSSSKLIDAEKDESDLSLKIINSGPLTDPDLVKIANDSLKRLLTEKSSRNIANNLLLK
jgi:hypothetical protein